MHDGNTIQRLVSPNVRTIIHVKESSYDQACVSGTLSYDQTLRLSYECSYALPNILTNILTHENESYERSFSTTATSFA